MRRWILLLTIILGYAGSIAVAQLPTEVGYTFDNERSDLYLAGKLLYFFPKDNFWDKGYGLECQVLYWWEYLGIGLSIGLSQWDVNRNDTVTASDPRTIEYTERVQSGETTTENVVTEEVEIDFEGKLDGDALIVPLGFSAVARPLHTEQMSLVFEAGLRLTFIDSNVSGRFNGTYTKDGREYEFSTKEDVDLDQGFTWLLGAEFMYAMSRDFSVLVGCGYQFDLSKAKANWKNGTEEIGGVSLDGPYARAGLVYRY